MLRSLLKTAFILALIVGVVYGAFWYLSHKPVPERITYGLSFNTIYARELGLNEREVFTAILDDLKVRHLRLAAHWTLVEPEQGTFDWSAIDYEVREASKRQADIVMSVGRRLPRWPECHVPEWAKQLSWEEQKVEVRELVTETVNRYKNEPAIIYWQVENEPFLEVFAKDHCGELDKDFLKEEVELVRSLDPTRPILVTDSGNLGTWHNAYRAGDAFGTSVYVYFWNPELGQFKTVLPPSFYRLKEGIMSLFFGEKKTFLIELSAEPWLLEPIVDVPLDTQIGRMNPEKFEEILDYARETRYDTQYLWGAEWWYWLKDQGRSDMWEKGKEVYSQ